MFNMLYQQYAITRASHMKYYETPANRRIWRVTMSLGIAFVLVVLFVAVVSVMGDGGE